MNENVKQLFLKASKDVEFHAELSVHEKNHYKPTIFWDDKQRIIYALYVLAYWKKKIQ